MTVFDRVITITCLASEGLFFNHSV